jgi:hypothetical protein
MDGNGLNEQLQRRAQQQAQQAQQVPQIQGQYQLQHGPMQPQLVRASTLNLSHHQSALNVPVTVNFLGDIFSMTSDWTQDELMNSRRLVSINCIQNYNHLSLQFSPVAQDDYVTGSPVLSCIYWRRSGRFYLTSVELISLLEHLVNCKFPVEEKNRIRRNLQSIKPLTISKTNEEYHELFDLIMNFSRPKPRRIEKDVKVIYWDHLKQALAKVLSKYIVAPQTSDPSQQQQQQRHFQAPLPSPPVYFQQPPQQHQVYLQGQPPVYFMPEDHDYSSNTTAAAPSMNNHPGVLTDSPITRSSSFTTSSTSFIEQSNQIHGMPQVYHSDSMLNLSTTAAPSQPPPPQSAQSQPLFNPRYHQPPLAPLPPPPQQVHYNTTGSSSSTSSLIQAPDQQQQQQQSYSIYIDPQQQQVQQHHLHQQHQPQQLHSGDHAYRETTDGNIDMRGVVSQHQHQHQHHHHHVPAPAPIIGGRSSSDDINDGSVVKLQGDANVDGNAGDGAEAEAAGEWGVVEGGVVLQYDQYGNPIFRSDYE